ncbi:hypothetical protein [Sphingomonas sp. ABOLG]|uniref:hypothetical protein n=1 Tax=Sphingomonas sp. ABOLG TaxID=1985880 RepID=UPI0013DE2F04|nr:hypothetical protein [Sphingomonas sp. ABOLG]
MSAPVDASTSATTSPSTTSIVIEAISDRIVCAASPRTAGSFSASRIRATFSSNRRTSAGCGRIFTSSDTSRPSWACSRSRSSSREASIAASVLLTTPESRLRDRLLISVSSWSSRRRISSSRSSLVRASRSTSRVNSRTNTSASSGVRRRPCSASSAAVSTIETRTAVEFPHVPRSRFRAQR